MTTPGLEWAVGAVALVVIYGALSRGLFLATEWARIGLVDTAGSLLDNPRFPKSERRFIEICLEDAHSAFSAWKMAFAAIIVFLRAPFVRINATGCSPVIQGREKFIDRWMIATIGNSPMAAAIFGIAFIFAIAVRMSVRSFAIAMAQRQDHHHNGKGAMA